MRSTLQTLAGILLEDAKVAKKKDDNVNFPQHGASPIHSFNARLNFFNALRTVVLE
jgi:hypothetical protein